MVSHLYIGGVKLLTNVIGIVRLIMGLLGNIIRGVTDEIEDTFEAIGEIFE